MEGTLFSSTNGSSNTNSGVKIAPNLLRELRNVFNKSNLKDGTGSLLTQMKPITKVNHTNKFDHDNKVQVQIHNKNYQFWVKAYVFTLL